MGVKKSMQTFFEAMEGNNLPRTGGKIINTPMGPFAWDNLQESWVNVNNGFKLPNMTIQELMMFGYDPSVDGGKDKVASIACDATFTAIFDDITRNISGSISAETPGNYSLVVSNTDRSYTYNCTPPKLKCFLYEADTTPILFNSLDLVTFLYSDNSGASFNLINDNTEITLDGSGTPSPKMEIGSFNRYRFRFNIPAGGSGNLPVEFDFRIVNMSTSPSQNILLVKVRA